MRKILFLLIFILFQPLVYSDWFLIIPQSGEDDDVKEAVEEVWNPDRGEGENVRSKYNEKAWELSLWWQLASWIMTWDTLIDFSAHLVNFMSQLGLVIWAVMIIYSGYIYASSVFTWNSSQGVEPVKKAIIWILIIIFSYAIMRTVTFMFL